MHQLKAFESKDLLMNDIKYRKINKNGQEIFINQYARLVQDKLECQKYSLSFMNRFHTGLSLHLHQLLLFY